MNQFNNFGAYLRFIRDLPEVQALTQHEFRSVLAYQFPNSLQTAFRNWYEARTYQALCPTGEDNGYPGDRAAFSLALKSAFFDSRYAWPKSTIDRALEAIARSLPEVREVDGYEELKPFVRGMKARIAATLDPKSPEALTGMLEALDSLLNRKRNEDGSADKDLPRDRSEGVPTPGCDCPRCVGLRQGREVTSEEPSNTLSRSMPPELRELLDSLKVQPPSAREQLIQQSETLRQAVADGTLPRVVAETLDALPPGLCEANIQAALTLSAELGFGDIVNPYVTAVRDHGKYPDFTALPIAGSAAEVRYNQVLSAARTQINA